MRLLLAVLTATMMVAGVLGVAAAPLALAVPALALAVPSPASSGPQAPDGSPQGPGGPGPVGDPALAPGRVVADIPPTMLNLYVSAARRCPGLPWTVLAAIGKVETDHGRGGEVSPAGAEGPMQFMPATWAAYGVDGDGDGVASIWDAPDAVPAAADYLCANGGHRPTGLANAVFNYNHSDSYVRLVLAWAARYTAAANQVASP